SKKGLPAVVTLRPSISFLVSLNIIVGPSSIVFLSGAHSLFVTLPSTVRFSAKTFWEFDGLMLSINWTTGAELSTLIQMPSSRKKMDNLDSVALFKLIALVSVFKKRFDRQTRYTARFTVEYEA
ncbi:hypothetical protein BCV72DRAFT_319302, partial [Rhizopus microsporus var. microsporus]